MNALLETPDPSLNSLSGKTIVLKLGGSAMLSQQSKLSIIKQTVELARNGVKVVVVHGGGPSVNDALAALGKETKKVAGLRVTDSEAIDVVVKVLSEVNQDLVTQFEACGASVMGVCAGPNNVLATEKLLVQDDNGQPVDLGWVGEIKRVDLFVLSRILDESRDIPVIAPLGIDADGNHYNINADHVALAVAAALRADSLLFLSDVPGILTDINDPKSKLSILSVDEAKQCIDDGIISGGMLPKIHSCIKGIGQGIAQIAIVDGSQELSVFKGILVPQEIGTVIWGGQQ